MAGNNLEQDQRALLRDLILPMRDSAGQRLSAQTLEPDWLIFQLHHLLVV